MNRQATPTPGPGPEETPGRSHLYVLDDNDEPVQEPDVLKWAEWYEQPGNDDRRIVAQTTFVDCCGQLLSTVFLGIDHDFTGKGPPILYETMSFGKGQAEGWVDRYSTREQAEQGHRLGVEAHVCD